MDLMRILRSLEEFLYELVGWMVFYPRTFWRILRHPAAIARYTQQELTGDPEHQFTDTISPVLMLILSVVLAHALEMASRLPLPNVDSPVGTLLFGSEQGLLLTRCVVFCAFALVAALVTLRQQRAVVTRETLRSPFSVQAFLVSPFVVLLTIGELLVRTQKAGSVGIGALICAFALAWYVWARASAYRALVGGGWWKALALVCAGVLVTALIVLTLLGVALA